jgi:DNA-binding transcriptional LysR family regulator
VVVLSRKLSYTQAAADLGLTQSALSRSIQAIEQRAGVRLFDRDRGGVHLTTIGRAYSVRAAALLREADDLERLLKDAGVGVQGEIAFGIAPLPATVLLPAALCEGLASTPELRSEVFVRNPEALLQLLVNEDVEFLVCAEGQMAATAPVKATPLGSLSISRLVRAGHPLLAAEDPADFQGFPLIVSGPFEPQETAAAPVAPHIILEDPGALARITEGSDAVWLSTPYAAAEEILQGRIQELPWPRGDAPRQFRLAMYSLDRRSLSPAALRLRDQFRSRLRTLSDRLGS